MPGCRAGLRRSRGRARDRPDVLRHRLKLSYEAQGEGVTPDHVMAEIVGRWRCPEAGRGGGRCGTGRHGPGPAPPASAGHEDPRIHVTLDHCARSRAGADPKLPAAAAGAFGAQRPACLAPARAGAELRGAARVPARRRRPCHRLEGDGAHRRAACAGDDRGARPAGADRRRPADVDVLRLAAQHEGGDRGRGRRARRVPHPRPGRPRRRHRLRRREIAEIRPQRTALPWTASSPRSPRPSRPSPPMRRRWTRCR